MRDSRREVRGRVRPGKASSLMGMVIGAGFVVLGLVLLGGGGFGGFGGMGAPPTFSAFAVVWLLAAVGITGFHAYNYFGRRGAATMEWEVDLPHGVEPGGEAWRAEGAAEITQAGGDDFDSRLRKLEGLRGDGLITEEEYAQKRAAILAEKW